MEEATPTPPHAKLIFSKHKYIEYQVGDMNLILSVPHGGRLRPSNIPPRDAGYYDPQTGKPRYDHEQEEKDAVNLPVRFKKDTNTIDLAVQVANEIKQLIGKRPHVIVCHLHRSKLDMNCDRDKAAFGVKLAVDAWTAYHKFIMDSKNSFGGKPGLFLDIHGQGHIENWVELGYTLTADQLNSGTYEGASTSIRFLANRKKDQASVQDLVCGLDSFGGLLLDEGYKVIPSPTYPGPAGGSYYAGGYNTQFHGSRTGGGIVDAIQIETPRFLRERVMIPEYSKALARTIVKFLDLYYKPTKESKEAKELRKEELRKAKALQKESNKV